jgi:APA family basic amino acid/polyamine antiporter
VGSAGWLIGVWLITGFMTIAAAVSYGELSAMFPKAGGQYIYLKEAYNPLVGFLYGWSFFSVIQTGTIAAVGVAFSKFAGYFFPALTLDEKNIIFQIGSWFKLYPAQLVAIALVIFLTYVNSRGVKEGKLIQRIFTSAKLLSLFGLILFGFLLAFNKEVWNGNWSSGFHFQHTTPVLDSAGKQTGWSLFQSPNSFFLSIALIASAMVGSVFSSVAWENVTYVAGEIKNPKKNVGLSLFLGTTIVIVIYVAANIMYTAVLPLTPAVPTNGVYATESAGNIAFAIQDRVATAASQNIFGEVGTYIIAIMIMVSTFGCNNGLVLSGARVYYTMAQDKLFFSRAGTLNKNGVPGWALWMQCIWASVLCLSGQYGLLLDYVVFVTLVFYILTLYGIFRLRKKMPDAERPYKAFGYPVLPILYFIVAGTMALALLIYKWQTSLPGICIIIIGVVLYYFVQGKKVKF